MLARKPVRDVKNKEKDKEKEREREEKKTQDRRNGQGSNRPNQGRFQKSRLPKALQKPARPQPKEEKKEVVKEITLPEKMTIRELAEKMKMQPAVIVKKLFMEGTMVTVNHEIDFEKAQEIALDYDIIAEQEEKVDVIEELSKRGRGRSEGYSFQDRRLSVLWVTLTMVKLHCWMRFVRPM